MAKYFEFKITTFNKKRRELTVKIQAPVNGTPEDIQIISGHKSITKEHILTHHMDELVEELKAKNTKFQY